jgi:hypothetical protein
VAPQDSAAWLRLAKAVLQIRPGNDQERTLLLERAATAAYIAYQRSASSTEEAEALVVVGRSYADRSLWRPALDALRISLELSEVANVRQQYERMRAEYGRARAFSSPRNWPSASISRRSSSSPARTSRRFPRRSASCASKGLSTASTTRSPCVPAFRRR